MGIFNHTNNLAKNYVKPKTKILSLTDTAQDYLLKVRGLNLQTISSYRLGCSKYGDIAIPFFDEHSELALIKFRDASGGMLKRKRKNADGSLDEYEAKTVTEPKGKPILFGSHLADPEAGALVICFGEFDAMAVSQDGVPNCVSLPFGDKGFQFLDLQWNFLERFDEIILYPDADNFTNPESEKKAKAKLEELAIRLGKHRLRIVNEKLRFGTKDANELLLKKGAGANLKSVREAEWYPTGIVSVADYVDEETSEGTPFGISEIDRVTGGAVGGHLIIMSGDNGAGKTTQTLNIIASFIKEQKPVFIWSGEQKVGKIRYWFERIVAGSRNLKMVIGQKTGFQYFFPCDDVIDRVRWWYRDYLFQLTDFNPTPEEFFSSAEVAIRRYGCKFIVIDNLMAFTGGEGEGYYQAQGDFAQNCKSFAEKWNVPVLLICHNRKEDERKIPGKSSIEGSKKITNWADVVFQMFRVPEERAEEFSNADALMIICKSRESGALEGIRLLFDRDSNRFWQLSDGAEAKDTTPGWEYA